MKRLALVALIGLAFAPAAFASTVIANPSELNAAPLYQQWIAQSAEPTPNVSITVEERSCTEYRAQFCAKTKQYIIVSPDWSYLYGNAAYSDFDRTLYRMTFMHELGHVLDLGVPHRSYAYRDSFLRIMGWNHKGAWPWRVTGRDWFDQVVRVGPDTYSAPFELFAVAYSFCSLSPYALPQDYFRMGGYGYHPSQRQHRSICRLIRVTL